MLLSCRLEICLCFFKKKNPVLLGEFQGDFWEEVTKGALAIRRIFSLVDMIKKPKFSNCPNVFIIGLFR